MIKQEYNHKTGIHYFLYYIVGWSWDLWCLASQ